MYEANEAQLGPHSIPPYHTDLEVPGLDQQRYPNIMHTSIKTFKQITLHFNVLLELLLLLLVSKKTETHARYHVCMMNDAGGNGE